MNKGKKTKFSGSEVFVKSFAEKDKEFLLKNQNLALRLINVVKISPQLDLQTINNIISSKVIFLSFVKNEKDSLKSKTISNDAENIRKKIQNLTDAIIEFNNINKEHIWNTYAITQAVMGDKNPHYIKNIESNLKEAEKYFSFIAEIPKQGFSDIKFDLKDYIGNYLVRDFIEMFGSNPIANHDPVENKIYGSFIDFARFIFAEAGFSRADVSDATIRAYKNAYNPDDPRFVDKETSGEVEKDKFTIIEIS